MSTISETQYAALTQGAGLVDFSCRTQIELTGADRASFLHNFCTNQVRDLHVGQGCEAFILNAKGHIVGHVFVFVCPSSIVLETVPDQAEKLIAQLDRYLIREDVQLIDRSSDWAEFYLAGTKSGQVLQKLGWQPPQERLAHAACQFSGGQVWLRNADLTPGGLLLVFPREFGAQLHTELTTAGAVDSSLEAFEAARIEAGTPLYDHEITEENLPQEVARDRLAISFTKGCYLGQETVARIDALGHVNRLLGGVKFSSDAAIPPPGTPLLQATGTSDATAKVVGRVTSACWSPRLKSPLALALVHRESAAAGTQLNSPIGVAEVVQLPLI
jgi:tRNA-modifying protein YgfZ